MREFAIAVVGRDRPGIAAGIAAALLKSNANIEDSRMTILGGHFTMMMLVSVPDQADMAALEADLDQVRQKLALEAVVLKQVETGFAGTQAQPTHVLTVYGVDHPGIVSTICDALAERAVNIDDLATRVTGGDNVAIYTMICELSLPSGLSEQSLREQLLLVGERAGVEVVLRELEADTL